MTADPAVGPAPRAPLRQVVPAVATAALYGVAALAWLALGRDVLPGRWLAVHLFTLGVLSNLVLALTDHFARTLLHTGAGRGHAGRMVVHNVGAVLVLAGLSVDATALVAVGATFVTAGVTWLYVDLRRMRRNSLGSRFAFVVRGYERACGAFIHGAVLGLLMGAGLLAGRWYGAARLAHLHVNVLGWGGLTLLATIVFFGPTMLRRRIADGAELTAPSALRWASTGLSVAAIALLLSGAGAPVDAALRLLAAAGLAVYAGGVTVIWRSVADAAGPAARSVERGLLSAVGAWFVLGVWADSVVVATGSWRLLDTVGAVLLLGVLAQAIIAALVYLGPMLRGASAEQRGVLRARLQRLPRAKAIVLNLGIALVLAAAAGVGAPVSPAVVGWALVAVAAGASLAPLVVPGSAA